MNEIEYHDPGSGGALFAWIFASVIAWSMTKPAAAFIGALVVALIVTAGMLWTVL